MSFERGSRFGSCATRAVRYCSTRFSKQARLQLSGIDPVDGAALRIRLPAKTVTTATATTPAMKRLERMALFSFTVSRILPVCVRNHKDTETQRGPEQSGDRHRNSSFNFVVC